MHLPFLKLLTQDPHDLQSDEAVRDQLRGERGRIYKRAPRERERERERT